MSPTNLRFTIPNKPTSFHKGNFLLYVTSQLGGVKRSLWDILPSSTLDHGRMENMTIFSRCVAASSTGSVVVRRIYILSLPSLWSCYIVDLLIHLFFKDMSCRASDSSPIMTALRNAWIQQGSQNNRAMNSFDTQQCRGPPWYVSVHHTRSTLPILKPMRIASPNVGKSWSVFHNDKEVPWFFMTLR